jgi:hypothetical protein
VVVPQLPDSTRKGFTVIEQAFDCKGMALPSVYTQIIDFIKKL